MHDEKEVEEQAKVALHNCVLESISSQSLTALGRATLKQAPNLPTLEFPRAPVAFPTQNLTQPTQRGTTLKDQGGPYKTPNHKPKPQTLLALEVSPPPFSPPPLPILGSSEASEAQANSKVVAGTPIMAPS